MEKQDLGNGWVYMYKTRHWFNYPNFLALYDKCVIVRDDRNKLWFGAFDWLDHG